MDPVERARWSALCYAVYGLWCMAISLIAATISGAFS